MFLITVRQYLKFLQNTFEYFIIYIKYIMFAFEFYCKLIIYQLIIMLKTLSHSFVWYFYNINIFVQKSHILTHCIYNCVLLTSFYCFKNSFRPKISLWGTCMSQNLINQLINYYIDTVNQGMRILDKNIYILNIQNKRL